MDKGKEHSLSQYDSDPAPAYNAGTTSNEWNTLGTTLTIDPTGMSVIELPLGSAPPRYTFNTSLVNVGSFGSVNVSRLDASGNNFAVYAIAERFISPLHTTRKSFRNVTVARSTGIFAAVGLRKIEWTFLTQTPIPTENGKIIDGPLPPAPMGSILATLGGDGIGVEKDLLRTIDGKWLDEHDQVVALAREGGVECEGMPVLSVTEGLHQEVMDFLVSAWCVTLWGELGKRAHHHQHHHRHQKRSSEDNVIR